jgi:hypothetical protein
MTLDEILVQVLDLLRRERRVSYRALKRRFALDDEYLEDLKAEIIKATQLAVDEDGEVLVWTGGEAKEETEKRGIGETEQIGLESRVQSLASEEPGRAFTVQTLDP